MEMERIAEEANVVPLPPQSPRGSAALDSPRRGGRLRALTSFRRRTVVKAAAAASLKAGLTLEDTGAAGGPVLERKYVVVGNHEFTLNHDLFVRGADNKFDKNGFLYWVGTRGPGNRLEEWANPCKLSHTGVTVARSGQQRNLLGSHRNAGGFPPAEDPQKGPAPGSGGTAADILELEPSDTWTKDVPDSWWLVCFGPKYHIRVSHYTVRHGRTLRSHTVAVAH